MQSPYCRSEHIAGKQPALFCVFLLCFLFAESSEAASSLPSTFGPKPSKVIIGKGNG